MRKFISSKLKQLAEWVAPGNKMDAILETGNWAL